MTYEENVRETAEEMAKEYYSSIGEAYPIWEEKINEIVSQHEYAARIAVRLQAEAFKQGFNFGRTGYSEDQDKGNTGYWIVLNRLLIERGLIPAPEPANHLSWKNCPCEICHINWDCMHPDDCHSINSPSNVQK